jgi:hypothetical protein
MASSRTPSAPESELVLWPHLDPTTGQLVYTEPGENGRLIALAGDPSTPPESPDWVGVPSRLPTQRMAAAASWDTILTALRDKENGRTTSTDLVVRPGGGVDLVASGTTERHSEPVSTLEPDRMAATMVGPSVADAEEIRRLDPHNVERWTPRQEGEFSGWMFEMVPPFASQGRFKFLVFRSPSDGNRLRISPLRPTYDHLFGHGPHMINVRLGGHVVPVICGPGGRAAANFTVARGYAAKWMIYASYRLAGRPAPFSE